MPNPRFRITEKRGRGEPDIKMLSAEEKEQMDKEKAEKEKNKNG